MIRDLILGVVGAFPGGWLFAVAFVVVGGGFFVSLLTAFVGAVWRTAVLPTSSVQSVIEAVAACLKPPSRETRR
jgi:uncharacterized membrane protein YeaQ/YmgE (transglycosylase-associated protein family)